MSKKLLIYGLAFGSATAALSYMYMVYVAFKPILWLHLLSVSSEIILIPGFAIFMFLKAVKIDNPTEFTMGRAIFQGFFLSVIISASVSLFYSYIAQFRPEIINGFIDLKIASFRNNKIFKTLKPKEIQENFEAIRDSYSVSGQFRFQLYLGAARGLFLSAVMAYFLKAKSAKS